MLSKSAKFREDWLSTDELKILKLSMLPSLDKEILYMWKTGRKQKKRGGEGKGFEGNLLGEKFERILCFCGRGQIKILLNSERFD